MTKTPAADNFDFAEWFGDATPEESHDVFTRTDLVGEINRLTRQIEEDDRAAVESGGEKGLGEEATPDEEKLAELLEEFMASKRTIYLRGLTQDERNKLRKQHEASGNGPEDWPRRCLSASIVAMRKPGEPRRPTKLTYGAVVKLHAQLGEGQTADLFKKYQQATSGIPTVDADFLQRRSGQGATEE